MLITLFYPLWTDLTPVNLLQRCQWKLTIREGGMTLCWLLCPLCCAVPGLSRAWLLRWWEGGDDFFLAFLTVVSWCSPTLTLQALMNICHSFKSKKTLYTSLILLLLFPLPKMPFHLFSSWRTHDQNRGPAHQSPAPGRIICHLCSSARYALCLCLSPRWSIHHWTALIFHFYKIHQASSRKGMCSICFYTKQIAQCAC